MRITVCIGSSCHIKGSRQVVEALQTLITEHNAADRVELAGAFCMGNCQNGVCATLDEKIFSLTPQTTRQFFETEVLTRL